LWGLLILVLPAFVLWGTGNIGGDKKKGPKFVGVINEKKITFDMLASNMLSIRSQIILNYFNQAELLKALLEKKPFIAKMAWNRLIMLNEARTRKITVSDKDVINQIKSHPLFNRNGKFDDKIYQYALRYNFGLSPRMFEETVRENMEIQKMNDVITKDVTATDEDIRNEYVKENGRFRISYAFIPLQDFTGNVTVDDAVITEYYEKHKTEIMIKPNSPDDKTPPRIATFDEAKADIKKALTEMEAGKLAYEKSRETYMLLEGLMSKESLSFEDAASKLGIALAESPFFSKTDTLETIGESPMLYAASVNVMSGGISQPVPAKNGFVIFKVIEIEKVDDEKLNTQKDELTKRALAYKKNIFLEEWLRALEKKTTLNINFDDSEEYFQ
jgi:peptidyl-prolyl cis-trans isomerase D